MQVYNRSEELTTPQAIAARLAICVSSVYGKIARGEIQAFRVGKLWRVPMSEVDRLVDRPAAAPEKVRS